MADEKSVELRFPIKGLDVSGGFDQQSPGTAPAAANVRGYEPASGRLKGGSRSGLSRYVNAPVGGVAGVIQHLAVIVDPTVEALLDTFDDADDSGDAVDDPSSAGSGLIDRRRGRRVRRGGTGRQPTKSRKRTPHVAWGNPADIYQYVPLTGTQLNAIATDPVTGAVVAGAFAYRPAFGYRLGVGRQQLLRTTFTPTDATRYRTARKTVKINVLEPDVEVVSVTYHGTVTSYPFLDERITIANVIMVVNGTTPVSLGNSGALSPVATSGLGLIGQDAAIYWPDSADLTGTVPPYGYFFVGS